MTSLLSYPFPMVWALLPPPVRSSRSVNVRIAVRDAAEGTLKGPLCGVSRAGHNVSPLYAISV